MENAEYMLKVLVAGDHLVGKTTFLERAATNRISGNVKSTIGVDFQVFMSSENTKIQAWDMSGQQRFRKITEAYFKQCQIVILCYSDDVRESKHNLLKEWYPLIKEKCKKFKCYVVKLKTDKESEDVFAQDDEWKELGATHFNVSAKRNVGYQNLFNTIVAENMDSRRYIGYHHNQTILASQSQSCGSCVVS